MTIIARLLPETYPLFGKECPVYALHFAKRSTKVILSDGTCYYSRLNILAEAISDNPAGPTGITLRQSISEAIKTAGGGSHPLQFIRF